MIFNYCDDEYRLGQKLREKIEEAAIEAVSGELDISRDELNEIPIELSITIVDADEIRQINNEFRGIDRITDVLSFPQYEGVDEILQAVSEGEEFGILLGDVVICYDRALEQAEEYETGADRELVYLTVHSIFHLLGYDHMEAEEKALMRSREEAVMTAIGLSR